MSARESFLSFARGAMEHETAYPYPHKMTPVGRADAVYQSLKPTEYPVGMPDPPSPLSPIWHLLSWVVVALAEHLSEAPKAEPTEIRRALYEASRRNANAGVAGRSWSVDDIREEWARGEALVVANELHDALYGLGSSTAALNVYAMSSHRELLAARIIKKLDEYRAGKRGEG